MPSAVSTWVGTLAKFPLRLTAAPHNSAGAVYPSRETVVSLILAQRGGPIRVLKQANPHYLAFDW